MRFFFVILYLSFPGLLHAQNTQWQWAGSGEDAGLGYSTGMTIDPSGNVYVSGVFSNTLTIGTYSLVSAGGTDAFIAKYTPGGQVLWAVRLGGSGDEDFNSLCMDSAGFLYNVGSFYGSADFGQETHTSNGEQDIYLSKLSPDGNFIWTKTWGGAFVDGGSKICFKNGYIHLVGYFYEDVLLDSIQLSSIGANVDALIVKTDTSGAVIWAKNAGGSLAALGFAIDCDASGDIYITGKGTGATMYFDAITTINTDVYVAKYDSAGNALWAKTIQALGNFPASGFAISCDHSGNVYIGGYSLQNQNYNFGTINIPNDNSFIAKYNSGGTLLWAKPLGIAGRENPYELVTDDEANLYISGLVYGIGAFGQDTLSWHGAEDILVVKMDSNGNHIWAVSAGGPANEGAHSLALDNTGGIFITGYISSSNVTFGIETLSVAPGNARDMFVAKLSQTTGLPVIPAVDKQLWGYPNPAGDVFYVNSVKEGVLYELRSTTGSIIANGKLHQGINQLSLADLPAGMYILRAATETFKIIKK